MVKHPNMRFYLLLLLLLPAQLLSAQDKEELEPYYIVSIYFGGGSYYIDDQQAQELHKWLDGIPRLEEHAISIHSHTDDIGGKAYNDWLSQMRSESALLQLLNRGLPEDIISIEDFGELNPVYDNSTWEGKLKNRRVDIIIRPLQT